MKAGSLKMGYEDDDDDDDDENENEEDEGDEEESTTQHEAEGNAGERASGRQTGKGGGTGDVRNSGRR